MKDEYILILASLLPVVLVVFVMLILFFFFRKKNRLLLEKQERELAFISETNKVKMEVKDEVLNQVAAELHDNIGQRMALSLIYSKALIKQFDRNKLESLHEVMQGTLDEVRQLAKLLNSDLIQQFDLVSSLEKLAQYISKLKVVNLELKVFGTPVELDANVEIVIFRMCQEFISNALKHSNCSKIVILLQLSADQVLVDIYDDGMGFDKETVIMGSGISAIQSRAKIINASVSIKSEPDEGTRLHIVYNLP